MKQITVKKVMPDEQADELSGCLLTDNDYDTVIDDDCIVLKEDGTPLLIYRKGVLPLEQCNAAYMNLRDAALRYSSDNRGTASGRVRVKSGYIGELRDVADDGSVKRFSPIKYDGTASNTDYSVIGEEGVRAIKRTGATIEQKRSDGTWVDREPEHTKNGIVGYMDGNGRFPYCRLTAFNMNEPDKFNAAMPMIQTVDSVFAASLPDRYAAQQAVVQQTSDDFYISGTVFTTLTVNMSFVTAIHQDAGDLKAGFGVMSALRAGDFSGCYTCFPQYRVAADMQTGDVLLADVHEWHGNTPLHATGRYERLSLVYYYRENMQHCDSAAEEVEKAKGNKGTSHLKDWH